MEAPPHGGRADKPHSMHGSFNARSRMLPLLGCYDLTRTSTLPGSDGCPNSTSSPYTFLGHADIREVSMFVEDTISLKNWTFNLGIRGDIYGRDY